MVHRSARVSSSSWVVRVAVTARRASASNSAGGAVTYCVCAGVLCVAVFFSTILYRDDLRRLYDPGVASEGCQSSDAV